MNKHTELCFEETIEHSLITQGGYQKRKPQSFDPQTGLFPEDLLAFIRTSQPKKWQKLYTFHGDRAKETLINALCKELASKGSLHVLRHGFKCFGTAFKAVSFLPNSGLNPQSWQEYQHNTLTLARQVRFHPKKHNLSVDMLLSVNGIPVVTLELKNPMTHQKVENAQNQYRQDRDPDCPLFRFKQRALVHFAVDTDLVFMTTKLEGKQTSFLPFNRGHDMAAGNPPISGNYRSAYLWEEVLAKDSLMDILAHFMHLHRKENRVETARGLKKHKKESMIFPRYHQLDSVRKIVADAKSKGAGHNYLIQHSAGSGKSNSIAWLAYRLSSLHDDQDNKVFDYNHCDHRSSGA